MTSSDPSSSFGWICVVEIVKLGSASMIHFPVFATIMFCSNSELEKISESEASIFLTDDYFERYSLVL